MHKKPIMPFNEHQLLCIYYIMEKEFSNAKEELKKANDKEHSSTNEWYWKGRLDAFEIIIGKLELIPELNNVKRKT